MQYSNQISGEGVDRAQMLISESGQRAHDAATSSARVLTSPESIPVFDNDCACPDAPLRLAAVSPPGTRFVCTPHTVLSALPGGYTMAFSPVATAGPCVLSPAALERWRSFTKPQVRGEPVDQDLAAQSLIQPEGGVIGFEQAQPATLTTWLHITNACNLDCPYCYIRKSSARMSLPIGRRAIDQIIEAALAHGFQRIKLKYAGGEASLHMRLVRELHAYLLDRLAPTGLQCHEVLLSNGVFLRDADADWLAEASVRLMISLDGIGPVHDAQRFSRRGLGSFAAVERTVDQVLLPRGIRPNICVTVTQRNALGAADAVRWALQRQLPVSLNFYRQTALAASHTDLQLEEQLIIEGMRRVYRAIEACMPAYSLLNGLLDRVQAQAHMHTCGVGLAYLVVTHEGKIAQCQMHMSDATSAHSDQNVIALVAQGPIRNLPVDQKEGCRDCSYRYRCTGGCPIETFRATGRWDVRSPHCGIYQSLYPEVLRLEGLRILKVHGLLQ